MLDPDREAQKVRRCGAVRTLDRKAVLDQALDAAERRRALPDLDLSGGGDRRLGPACDPDAEHSAKPPGHLAGGDRVSGMGGQSGIQNFGDPRVRRQRFSNLLRRMAGALDPRKQGAHPAEK